MEALKAYHIGLLKPSAALYDEMKTLVAPLIDKAVSGNITKASPIAGTTATIYSQIHLPFTYA